MRACLTILVLCLIVGCSAKPQPVRSTPAPLVASSATFDCSVTASALVFDPPIARNEPVLDLAREGRQASAFVGYDQITTTFSAVFSDDRQEFLNFHTGD